MEPTRPPPTDEQLRLQEGLKIRLDHLAHETGVPIRADLVELEPTANGQRADALVDLRIADDHQRYVVEMKNNVDRYVVLGQVKNLFENFNEPGLLFAPYITPAIAKRCRELEIGFLDELGNAYLRAPGHFIFITGNKPQALIQERQELRAEIVRAQWAPRPIENTRHGGMTPTALKVVFALLCRREFVNAPYREIREVAQVALGAIGWVFFDLENRGLVVGKQPRRRIVDPKRLLEEWVNNYPTKLRPKLNVQRFRAPDHEWWRKAGLGELGGYWGGEVAAERLTQYLKPANQTIYVPAAKRREITTRLVQEHRLQADYKGEVEILDTFWTFPPDPWHTELAPPLLVYADLVATADPRNLETARMIRERYINDALNQS